jgi:zinc finger HIT domain-containing protein 3
LTSIDKLRGDERDEALQRALGITAPEIDDQLRPSNLSDEILALRELAEAIETAVRGRDQSALGLNWGE